MTFSSYSPARYGIEGFRSSLLRAVTTCIVLGLLIYHCPSAGAYVNPATGGSRVSGVLRGFDKPEYNWLPGHRGVDLHLSEGDPVRSAGAGVVSFSGVVAGTPSVSITHPDGIRTTYQPAHPLVAEGDRVQEGQVIATLGHPFDGKPGLHWGAKREEDYLNPLSLLNAAEIRLKPLP